MLLYVSYVIGLLTNCDDLKCVIELEELSASA